jgi:hypothetical protein
MEGKKGHVSVPFFAEYQGKLNYQMFKAERLPRTYGR